MFIEYRCYKKLSTPEESHVCRILQSVSLWFHKYFYLQFGLDNFNVNDPPYQQLLNIGGVAFLLNNILGVQPLKQMRFFIWNIKLLKEIGILLSETDLPVMLFLVPDVIDHITQVGMAV